MNLPDRKYNWMQWIKPATISCLIVSLIACQSIGPKALRKGRTNYNDAIKSTEVEQFLLNIVRLRYNDRPYVLEVSSISSRLEAGGEARLTATDRDNIAEANPVGASASVTYLEKPTIVYQPLTGQNFVRQLLTPVDLNTLLLLRQAGWELDDIFRVFVSSINGIVNASTGGSSSPEGVPEFKDFLKVTKVMDQMEDAGSLSMASTSTANAKELAIRVRPEFRETPAFEEFSRLLKLDARYSRYRLRLGLDEGGGRDIVISTRPILSAMFYVGQSIEIPEELVRSGTAHMNRDKNGELFDWRQVHSKLMNIHSSSDKPENAYAAVEYQGYWYYIKNNDNNSKETLTMLSIVFTLNAGGDSAQAPLMTIPID